MFKIGDVVKLVTTRFDDETSNPWWGGRFGYIKGSVSDLGIDYIRVSWDTGRSNTYHTTDLELINNDSSKESNKTMPNLKEKFLLAITAEPMKSFRKAGITNGDDLLTEDGEKVFLSWLLTKNQEEFKKEVVDQILEEK